MFLRTLVYQPVFEVGLISLSLCIRFGIPQACIQPSNSSFKTVSPSHLFVSGDTRVNLAFVTSMVLFPTILPPHDGLELRRLPYPFTLFYPTVTTTATFPRASSFASASVAFLSF